VALVTVPVIDLVPVTPRSRLVVIDLRGQTLPFLPGQAVIIGAHGQEQRRPYSIACSPERTAETGRLELLITAEPGGDLGPSMATATPGMLVDVEGPLGLFTLPGEGHHGRILFVAGGTGIAPLRSMLDHLLRRQAPPAMSLLYSARRSDEFAFIDELRGHAETGRLELHQTVTRDDSATWGGRRGRIGRSHFEAVLHDPAATLCFVCGPAPLVSESVLVLEALGVPGQHIRTEQWGR
jgi:ferredoxin-NADP reductase